MCNKIHSYSKHGGGGRKKERKKRDELAKIMVFWDLTLYSLEYVDCFCEVPVILHNDLQCKTHQLAK